MKIGGNAQKKNIPYGTLFLCTVRISSIYVNRKFANVFFLSLVFFKRIPA